MKKQWAEKSYEAAADHVAKELTLLRAVIFSDEIDKTKSTCEAPKSRSKSSKDK